MVLQSRWPSMYRHLRIIAVAALLGPERPGFGSKSVKLADLGRVASMFLQINSRVTAWLSAAAMDLVNAPTRDPCSSVYSQTPSSPDPQGVRVMKFFPRGSSFKLPGLSEQPGSESRKIMLSLTRERTRGPRCRRAADREPCELSGNSTKSVHVVFSVVRCRRCVTSISRIPQRSPGVESTWSTGTRD